MSASTVIKNTNLDTEEENEQKEVVAQAQQDSLAKQQLNETSNTSGIGNSICSPLSDTYTGFRSGNGSVNSTPATPGSNTSNSNSSSSTGTTSSNSNSTPSSSTSNDNPQSTVSTSKINVNAPAFHLNTSKLNQQSSTNDLMNKLAMQKNLSIDNLANIANDDSASIQADKNNNNLYMSNMNNFLSLPVGLGGTNLNGLLNQVDYDPFNDYMGVDKMVLQMAAATNGNGVDGQKQQQLIAQAIAAAAAATANNNSNNSDKQSAQQNISVLENIEILNSKFMNQKQSHQQSNSNTASLNSLLASVAAAAASNYNGNGSANDSSFGSPQQSNPKRQSTGAFMQSSIGQAALFSTPIPNDASSSPNSAGNSRLNSTPNLVYGTGSNSSFNLSSSNNMEMSPCIGNMNANSSNNISPNTSTFEDDDVFSQSTANNNNFANQNQLNNLNALCQSLNLNNNNNNLDTYALAQLYRNLFNNGSNLNASNLSELLLNSSNSNCADILNTNNSNNFLNMSSSSSATNSSSANNTLNQLKNCSGLNLSSSSNQNGGNNQAGGQNNFNLSPAAMAAAAAAVLKQRQNSMMNNRTNNNSNIAALTSVTSNMASLLANNNNSQNGQNSLSQQQQAFLNGSNDAFLKKRVNSYNLTSSSSVNQIGNNSGLFPSASTHQVGPNATHLLQNSSLASSARLNSSTSSSAAASVLGNNSSLSHALNSLQHHQSSSSSGNHSLLGNSTSSSGMNFNNSLNSSPSPSSNHGLLSALSLSGSSGSSIGTALLSASGKPLRSERLPSQVVDEMIKQAKNRRRNGGKKEVCVFCRNNGEKEPIYTSHTLKDASNNVACPILRLYQCPICHASGDQAHTIKYCPYAEKDSQCIKLFKENGRMSAAAAAYLMNSLNGTNTPPSSSPPSTPSPLNQGQQMSFLNLSHSQSSASPTISSPNASTATLSLAQALNNLNGFNSAGFNLNKSFGSISNTSSPSSSSNNFVNGNSLHSNMTSSLSTSNFSNNLNSK